MLDVSLDKNREALIAALATGARVFYADHHFPGEIPQHELLDCHIDVAADTCTSLIVNKLLGNAQARWAVVGALVITSTSRQLSSVIPSGSMLTVLSRCSSSESA